MKPIIILPNELMTEENVNQLRDNGLCVVTSCYDIEKRAEIERIARADAKAERAKLKALKDKPEKSTES